MATALADDGLDEAIAALRAFALIDRESIMDERDASIATDAVRLHRLLREVAAARCEGEARGKLQRAQRVDAVGEQAAVSGKDRLVIDRRYVVSGRRRYDPRAMYGV